MQKIDHGKNAHKKSVIKKKWVWVIVPGAFAREPAKTLGPEKKPDTSVAILLVKPNTHR